MKTNEEIIRDLQKDKDRDKALTLLYKNNRPMIHKIAGERADYREPIFDDLMQEGFIGLMTALDRYDPDHESGAGFLTYAIPWIRQAMTRKQPDYEAVVIPDNEKQAYYKYRKIENQRTAQGLPCTLEDMARACKWTIDKTERVQSYELILNQASLDMPLGEDDSLTLGETIEGTNRTDKAVIGELWEDYKRAILWGEVDTLDGRQRRIIIDRFKNDKTLEEAGQLEGLTIEGARQLSLKAFKKLKHKGSILAIAREEERISSYEKMKGSYQRTDNQAIDNIMSEEYLRELRAKYVAWYRGETV